MQVALFITVRTAKVATLEAQRSLLQQAERIALGKAPDGISILTNQRKRMANIVLSSDIAVSRIQKRSPNVCTKTRKIALELKMLST
jgi:hypothetical protein